MVQLARKGDGEIARRHLAITGIVQGVGFRPFLFRLAAETGLTGWVRNNPAGVEAELQGEAQLLDRFVDRLQAELPPLAQISSIEQHDLPDQPDESGFEILSSCYGSPEAQITPDAATCKDCIREMGDPASRRYRHPFITCTNCGPRWTIVTGIPYDRPFTTMAGFVICPDCRAEYENPADRRFHAQPIACHDCGPSLALIPHHNDPLAQTINLLRQGQTVAVKGLGGFHLAVDACSDQAVANLRQRKLRDEKPFAVMVKDLATAHMLAQLSDKEARLLAGPEAPIVIVRRKPDSAVSQLVAPGSDWIGLMLAYTPVHHLLFSDSGLAALVMTSANQPDEPMVCSDTEAASRLSSIVDAILTHNRPVHIRTDDSVIRVFQDRPLFYRRSRGYVPRPVTLPFDAGQILALGAELKSTVCITRGDQAYLSQHIGDLKNEATLDSFSQTIEHLQEILEIRPTTIACDLHPDYLSTRYAEGKAPLRMVQVQHHHAHMASCMAENRLDGELIGVILDGTGLGGDGTVWGGEFLTGGYTSFTRAGHLKQVRLPGGDTAARAPWRMAMAWLHEPLGEDVWELPNMPQPADSERQMLITMLKRGLNSPLTSSAGRLFDAAAFITGAALRNSFDGQAGMALEALAESATETAGLAEPGVSELPGLPFQIDCAPSLLALVSGIRDGYNPAALARGFHAALAAGITSGCNLIRSSSGLDRVVLSGGVFQNRLLSELVHRSLTEHGFKVFTHCLVPPNDGGIALGQAAVAAKRS